MECEKFRRLIGPYLDNELDTSLCIEFEDHMEQCPTCRQIFSMEEKFQKALKRHLTSDDDMQTMWHASLKSLDKKEQPWHRLMPLGSLCLVVLFAFIFLLMGQGKKRVNTLAFAALTNHNKYVSDRLQLKFFSESPLDVENYLKGKLPFDVDIPQTHALASVRLVGGSKCHLKEVPVAFLVYFFKEEPVSIFVMDAEQSHQFLETAHIPREGLIKHYAFDQKNVVLTSQDDRVLLAVGKVEPQQLESFVQSY